MPREVIHTYQKFGTTTEFYIDENGILHAQVTDGSYERDVPFIRGLPIELRVGLLDETKKTHLKRILEDSYFVTMGSEVQVNAKLKGGWGNRVHGGRVDQPHGGLRGKTFSDHSERVLSEVEKEHSTAQYLVGPGQYRSVTIFGAYDWALKLGFSAEQSARIAEACVWVDYDDDTKPDDMVACALGEASAKQRWHFDINAQSACVSWEAYKDGWSGDARLNIAAHCLEEAIRLYRLGRSSEAFENLGKGLHPLQDVYAHTKHFVFNFDFLATFAIHSWIGAENYKQDVRHADNPIYINEEEGNEESPRTFIRYENATDEDDKGECYFSQRYSDAKTATYLYLISFLKQTGLDDSTTHKDRVSKITDQIFGHGIYVRHPRINESNAQKFLWVVEGCPKLRNGVPTNVVALVKRFDRRLQACSDFYNAAKSNDLRKLKAAISGSATFTFISVSGGRTVYVDTASDSLSWTALHWAVWHGNEEMVKLILQNVGVARSEARSFIDRQTASPSLFGRMFGNGGEHTALHILTYRATYDEGKKRRIKKSLLDAGANPVLTDSAGHQASPGDRIVQKVEATIKRTMRLTVEIAGMLQSKPDKVWADLSLKITLDGIMLGQCEFHGAWVSSGHILETFKTIEKFFGPKKEGIRSVDLSLTTGCDLKMGKYGGKYYIAVRSYNEAQTICKQMSILSPWYNEPVIEASKAALVVIEHLKEEVGTEAVRGGPGM